MKNTRMILAIALIAAGVLSVGLAHAEEAEVRVAKGSGYAALRWYELQVNKADAMIHIPGEFEGTHPIEFGAGYGFGFAFGVTGEQDWYLAGLELELLKNYSDIISPLPTSYLEYANSFEQLSINLNGRLGLNLYDRKFRPYVFGGFGYTEASLIGSHGLAQVDRGEESWANTFGYHAGIGAELKVYKQFFLEAGYRYYASTDPKIGNETQWIEFPNSGHMVHIGVAYILPFKSVK